MYVPSGLQDTVLLNTLARKLICLAAPPATRATHTLVKDFPPVDVKAIHLLSGEKTNERMAPRGARSKIPLASRRSCFESRSMTRSSRASRSNARDFPSGEKAGDASPVAAFVS